MDINEKICKYLKRKKELVTAKQISEDLKLPIDIVMGHLTFLRQPGFYSPYLVIKKEINHISYYTIAEFKITKEELTNSIRFFDFKRRG